MRRDEEQCRRSVMKRPPRTADEMMEFIGICTRVIGDGLVFMRFFRLLSASALLHAALRLAVRRTAGALLVQLVVKAT